MGNVGEAVWDAFIVSQPLCQLVQVWALLNLVDTVDTLK